MVVDKTGTDLKVVQVPCERQAFSIAAGGQPHQLCQEHTEVLSILEQCRNFPLRKFHGPRAEE